MNQNELIGLNIKNLREKMGINQTELGVYLKLSREAISLYESGKRNIPTLVIKKAAELFGIDEYDLFEENPESLAATMAFAFRADEIQPSDLESIAFFRKIVKNYLNMKAASVNE